MAEPSVSTTELVVASTGEVVHAAEVSIPATLEGLRSFIDGAVGLMTSGFWGTAAGVYAYTVDAPGRRTDLLNPAEKPARLSLKDFAALGFRGLTDRDTVSYYRRAWQFAVDQGQAQPTGPGAAHVLLPTIDPPAESMLRVREKTTQIAEITGEAAPLDAIGPFEVLYADPPWRYDFSRSDSRQIENQYPTMALEEICALDVPAADNSILFLWATSPKLREALVVLEAWGFGYLTSMVWVKDKIGMGYYARQQHELLLIARRGDMGPPDPEDRPSSVVTAPRVAHSTKPDEFHTLIERMYPFAAPWCELFQRVSRNGWVGWGNQA